MHKFILTFVAVFGLSATASAGTLNIQGEGTVYHEAETASFSVMVTSSCYSIVDRAFETNNSVANSLTDGLKKHLESSGTCCGKVTTSGLSIIQTKKSEYDNSSCDGWTTTNSINLTMEQKGAMCEGKSVEFGEAVAETYRTAVNTAVDTIASLPVSSDDPKIAETIASYGNVSFGLKDETRVNQEKEALKKAIDDAKSKRDIILKECNLKLVGEGDDLNTGSMSIPTYSSSQNNYASRSLESAGSGSTPPVVASSIPTTATVSFTWNVDGPVKCEK